jgi:ABC-type nitrate/sulfonate/bicarbonate transport system substrate-binding protein
MCAKLLGTIDIEAVKQETSDEDKRINGQPFPSPRGRGVNSKLVWVIDNPGTTDTIIGPQNIIMSDLRGKKIDIEGRSTFSHIFVPQALAKWGLYEFRIFLLRLY